MLGIIQKGIKSKLSGAVAITSLVSTRIYNLQAPVSTAFPVVVFGFNAGGDAHDNQRREADVRFMVKGIADVATTAIQLADAIDQTLHDATLTLDAPWQTFRVQAISLINFVENVEQKQLFHMGAVYRIRAFYNQ